MSDRELERLRFWQIVFASCIAVNHGTDYAARMADCSLKLWDERFGPEHTKTV